MLAFPIAWEMGMFKKKVCGFSCEAKSPLEQLPGGPLKERSEGQVQVQPALCEGRQDTSMVPAG